MIWITIIAIIAYGLIRSCPQWIEFVHSFRLISSRLTPKVVPSSRWPWIRRLALHFTFAQSTFIRPVRHVRAFCTLVELFIILFSSRAPLMPDQPNTADRCSPTRRTLLETNARRRARSVTRIRTPIWETVGDSETCTCKRLVGRGASKRVRRTDSPWNDNNNKRRCLVSATCI